MRVCGLLFVVTAALVLGPAPAEAQHAPFCVVSGAGQQCFYYDANACQQAAASLRGACVANVPAQDASGGAPFCLVGGFGAQCVYYDMDACRSAAAGSGAACIVNPQR